MPDLLTVDAAVAMLDNPPAPEEADPSAQAPEAAAEPAEAQPAEAEPAEPAEAPATEQEADPSAEAEAGAEGELAEAEAEQVDPAKPAIEPPRSWDTTAREHWAKMPRELQQVVLEREADRDRAVATAVQEASETKRASQAEVAKVQTLADQLGKFLPEAIETFRSRWGDAPDWEAVYEQRGVEEGLKLKARYDREREQIGELTRREAEAKDLAFQNFVKTESEKLREVSPELSDVVKGPQLRLDVANYALREGTVTEADLRFVTAKQLAMAHKAMLWDAIPAEVRSAIREGKLPTAAATIPTNPAQKPAPAAKPQARPAARPSASAPVSTPQRAQAAAANRFAQTKTIDDAVALLDLRAR